MQPLTNLLPSEYLRIAEEVKVPLVNLVKAISLFEEGATVPFVARYRKETTGNMNEEQLRLLEERLAYFRELSERRQTILHTIEGQGKLTAELRATIEATLDKNELEDLYLPYRPKRKTRADAAREKGLEPLAEWLWRQEADGRTPELAAETSLNQETGVETTEQALAGARDIVAERISDDPELRKALRKMMWEEGVVLARKNEKADELAAQQKDQRHKYETYFDFHEPVSRIPSHRLLAIRRGVKEGFLQSEVRLDEAKPLAFLLSRVIRDGSSAFARQLEMAARDAYQRLVNPSIQTEVRAALKERADDEAIRVFRENVQTLLLAPPAGPIAVMGVDPGFRTGCKLAVVDQTGGFLEAAAIYPSEPRNDAAGARAMLKDLIARHNVRAIAIGNGTGSREIDLFVRAFLRDEKIDNAFSIVVSESGASVYSASKLAREEFPALDVTLRGAVSIARRLQDPLAELVKIEPKAIGVGQYQHDIEQKKLTDGLHAIVESCVNRVGVDLNTASSALLKYVAGLNERVAKRVLEHRQQNGAFRSRQQLKDVPGLGDRIYQQAAGFLRIRDGENPLDRTAVHPESYAVVEKMAGSLGVTVEELIARPELSEQLKLDQFKSDTTGIYTLQDIQEELRRPGRDPREKFVAPHYRDDILQISDLKEGMELEGTVSNVTNFGAFVDLGIHQDGLVHVSELSEKFIKDPREAVKVGDVVRVRVLAADTEGKRISLSMKPRRPPKAERAPGVAEAAGSNGATGRTGRDTRGRPARRARAAADGRAGERKLAPGEVRSGGGRQLEAVPAPANSADGSQVKSAGAPKPAKTKPAREQKLPPQRLSMEEKLAILQSKFRTRI